MQMKPEKPALDPALQMILQARHYDPFSVLGRHPVGNDGEVIRVFLPAAAHVGIDTQRDIFPMQRLEATDLFEWRGLTDQVPERYRLVWEDASGTIHHGYDPYCFPPQLTDYDLHLFSEGKHWHAYRFMGAHSRVVDGISGVLFAVWAPNAERVSVVGDFNAWDGRCHPMRIREGKGVWELFIPGLETGLLYKFELRSRDSGQIHVKSDPYGQYFELRPSTASIAMPESTFSWNDEAWMRTRKDADWLHQPMSIYEVHLGSWQRDEQGGFLNYRELAKRLVQYVTELGFTHIELLPITEHPYDASWGYQTLGYYAVTSRHGTPDDFRWFMDYCHSHRIGVLLDWVPGHFPKDAHGLARFDGSAAYEHEDPRSGEHRDWGTLIFNYGRSEVKNFLISSALYWLEEFHIDGLRVDAVASMLYRDYSREPGEWVPNIHGGRENLEAIEFLRQLNTITHQQCPGSLIMAEESTSWPMVSRPVDMGGLGFSMKWNMGWMNDTLEYVRLDPIYRQYHHNELTFAQIYAYTENFILPFSHDEVVHGKGSMLYKMPGDDWQRFANLRLLYTYMFTQPGKKLLFMGCEFGQGQEWDSARALDWYVLDYPKHQGVKKLVGDLNRLYQKSTALYRYDFEGRGFEWIDCNDASHSVLSYLRVSDDETMVVVLNFTPTVHAQYRIGVPQRGAYRILLTSDSEFYGGSNMHNEDIIRADMIPWMGKPYSISINLPSLAGVILKAGE